ncbi:hypothetical protein NEUTE1DRAFT_142927 [Neurospora tetrasperma FGSC 2508]|uniref:Uncharacterized protein n=1 Tax=Neurospora tetrasperma (strain FGSC 2508 / ATCC MYA-4615 / P0657) TaxID=510951 RepID=F8N1D1_NEUT8|nr:uncharacterized protein NEUTE1DRAFT_142927 [Neurospora tetrasperma FGSC 2508]EGO53111.1 hypothetical protein NEUTE1DRAFT_142927 [Neurospora tetrasperma FGSC 2508]
MNATVSAVAWFRIPDIPALLELSTEPSPLGKGTINSHPATSSEKAGRRDQADLSLPPFSKV